MSPQTGVAVCAVEEPDGTENSKGSLQVRRPWHHRRRAHPYDVSKHDDGIDLA